MQAHITKSPYWWAGGVDLDVPPMDKLPAFVDVAVVGGGFTGLSAALTAAEAGRSTLVLDAGNPGRAASTRNGGICSGNIRVPHARLTAMKGRDYADSVYSEAEEARDDLAAFITTHKIDCGYRLAGYFKGALSPRDFEAMKPEVDRLNQLPGHHVRLVSRSEQHEDINTDRFFGGICWEGIAGYHPGKFFSGLLRVVQAAGVQIAPYTEVQMISAAEEKGGRRGHHVIHTDKGTVHAGHVIVATNAYTGRKPSFGHYLRRRLVPVQSCIIVTETLGRQQVEALMPAMRMYGNTAKLSCYFRPVPDGERILLGARSFDKEIPSDKSVRFLQKMLAEMFPSLKDVGVAYSWLGNVAFNRSHLPSIFTHNHIIYASGYAGSGTVWARWLGKKAAQKALLLGNRPSVFDGPAPKAVPLYDGAPWFMPAINAGYAVQDWINSRRFHQK